jgi:hypothetical protein
MKMRLPKVINIYQLLGVVMTFKFFVLFLALLQATHLLADDIPENPQATPGRNGEIHEVVDEMIKESQANRKIQVAKAQAWLDERMLSGHTIKNELKQTKKRGRAG